MSTGLAGCSSGARDQSDQTTSRARDRHHQRSARYRPRRARPAPCRHSRLFPRRQPAGEPPVVLDRLGDRQPEARSPAGRPWPTMGTLSGLRTMAAKCRSASDSPSQQPARGSAAVQATAGDDQPTPAQIDHRQGGQRAEPQAHRSRATRSRAALTASGNSAGRPAAARAAEQAECRGGRQTSRGSCGEAALAATAAIAATILPLRRPNRTSPAGRPRRR